MSSEHRAKVLQPVLKLCAVSLREMDIELMRRLSPRCNVIPVIGKADSLTPAELAGFKKRVGRIDALRVQITKADGCLRYAGHGGYRTLWYPRLQLPL